jgi:uncharacterized protein (UPF0332 family)
MSQDEVDILVAFRLNKAEETMDEVLIHVEHKLWNTALNRSYYACFYAVTALLLKNDIHARKHSGVQQMFGLHFIKTGIISPTSGKIFVDLFEKRLSADYEDLVCYEKEDVLPMLEPAKELISEIRSLLSKVG